MRATLIATAVAVAFSADCSLAAPTGGQVTNGSGTISQSGAITTINQSSQNLSLTWRSFNTAASETVNFAQPSASAIAVNRILDTNGTQFFGHLNANGQVYLINPNGILFGQGSQVNVGGLVASTLDINDANLGNTTRSFGGAGTGSVVNQGNITGGYVALLGNTVNNQGTIVADGGTAALGAGNAVTLTFDGNTLVKLQVDGSTLNNLAANGGLIRADGGTVLMSAGARDALLASVVNNTGVIEARTVGNVNGKIVLMGGMQAGTVNVGGTLDTSAANGGNGGSIETSAAHVQVSDSARITTASASGQTGSWLLDPVDFTIAAFGGDITATALNALLNSNSITIQTATGTNSATNLYGTSGSSGNINVNAAVSWFKNTLTLDAQNNIYIRANLNGSGTASLALQYGQGAVAAGNASNYYLSNGAQVNLPAGANFSTKLGSNGATNTYTVITSLGTSASSNDGTLQGMIGALGSNYALGANIDASTTNTWNAGAGFSSIGDNTGGATQFSGMFDGLGHTISNLSINRSNGNFGLFGYTKNAVLQNVGLLNVAISGGGNGGTGALAGIANNTIIRNSYVDGGSVYSSTQIVGGLVGGTLGTSAISYSYANVSVSAGLGGGSGYAAVGGLVGVNNGAISYSYATGSVSAPVGNGASMYIGGLVGLQNAGSGIDHSYATGAVSGNNTLGGLLGSLGGGSAPVSSYWDTTTTGQGSSAGGGTGLTTAQMQNPSTYSSWSTTSSRGSATTAVWYVSQGYYPVLEDLINQPLVVVTPSYILGPVSQIETGLLPPQAATPAQAALQPQKPGTSTTIVVSQNDNAEAAFNNGFTKTLAGQDAAVSGLQLLIMGGGMKLPQDAGSPNNGKKEEKL